MRKANANGSFEQQAIGYLSRVYHANNKRKQNNKKITNESNLRVCLHEGGGPQEGEVTRLGGVTRLSI